MKRTSLKLAVLMALVALALLVPAAGEVAHAATLCVDASGTQECFLDIQSAVDAASPGDTIYVYPGIYAGNIVVDKADLIIQRAPGTSPKPIVTDEVPSPFLRQARGADILGLASVPQYGFILIANRVRISGFEIYGFDNTEWSGGILVGGLIPGDMNHRAGGATIQRNTIHNNRYGVYLWQSNNNTVTLNTVYNSIDTNGSEGVGIMAWSGLCNSQVNAGNAANKSGKNNKITSNTVYSNDRQGIFAGAKTERPWCPTGPVGAHANMAGMQISSNTLYGNGRQGAEALGLMDVHLGTVNGNNIHDNKSAGILVYYSDGLTVTSNTLTYNGNVGIGVFKSKNNTFSGNSAFNNSLFDLFWDRLNSQTFGSNMCDRADPIEAWRCGPRVIGLQ